MSTFKFSASTTCPLVSPAIPHVSFFSLCWGHCSSASLNRGSFSPRQPQLFVLMFLIWCSSLDAWWLVYKLQRGGLEHRRLLWCSRTGRIHSYYKLAFQILSTINVTLAWKSLMQYIWTWLPSERTRGAPEGTKSLRFKTYDLSYYAGDVQMMQLEIYRRLLCFIFVSLRFMML